MAFSPETIAAYKAATGRLPSAGMRKLPPDAPVVPAAPAYTPLVYPEEPAYQSPPPPAPTMLGDVGNLYASGLDTSQANVQRALTGYGLGDWSQEEAANRALAEQERMQVSPETRGAMAQMKWTDQGPEGFSARGLVGQAAQGVGNVGTVAGVVGGALQMVPHPLTKAAGFALGAGANALDIGGSASDDVKQLGGTPDQQQQALYGGTALGAVSGLADVALLSKIGGLAGLEKSAVRAGLETAAKAGTPDAVAKLAALNAAEAAAKAAPLATKAGVFAKELALTTGVGALGEGIQEYGESGGQQVVENIALNKPWAEGAHPAGMLGATIGAFTGGVMGAGAHVGTQTVQGLLPTVEPGTATQVGMEQQTREQEVPFTRTGSASDVDLNVVASNVNDATDAALNTAPIVATPNAAVASPIVAGTPAPTVAATVTDTLNDSLGTVSQPTTITTTETTPHVDPTREEGIPATPLGVPSPSVDSGVSPAGGPDLAAVSEPAGQAAVSDSDAAKAAFDAFYGTAPAPAPKSLLRDTTPIAPAPDLAAVSEPTIQDRLAKFAASPEIQHVEIDDAKTFAKKSKAGGTRMQRNRATGELVVDPRHLEAIQRAHDDGKPELANALMTQLEGAKNHEDIHGVMRGEGGKLTPAFEAMTVQASNPGTKIHEWVRGSLPLLLKKTYIDEFKAMGLDLSDIDMTKSGERSLAVAAIMSHPESRQLALNELAAGHPKAGAISDEAYANYIAMRPGILQALGATDEHVNTPIPSRLHADHLPGLEALHTLKVAAEPETIADTELTDVERAAFGMAPVTKREGPRGPSFPSIAPTRVVSPTRTVRPLTKEAPTFEPVTEEVKLPDVPPPEHHVLGIDSYYTDAKGNRVTSVNDAASSSKAGPKDSIIRRAVQLMHEFTTGAKQGLVAHVGGTEYRIGDAVYNLVKEGTDMEIRPATGLSETHDVIVEYKDGKYRTKVNDYAAAPGPGAIKATASRLLAKGMEDARAIEHGTQKIGEQEAAAGEARSTVGFEFTLSDGSEETKRVTVSALRKLGASINGRPNTTLADKLANVKAGIAYTIANIGPMKGTDINALIVSDTETDTVNPTVTLREAERLTSATQYELDAAKVATAAQKILGGLSDKKLLARIAAEGNQDVKDLVDRLQGELQNNKRLDVWKWVMAKKKNAAAIAKNYTGSEDLSEMTAGIDPYVRTMASDEPLTDVEMAADKKHVAPVDRPITTQTITNNKAVSAPVEKFLNGLIAKLGIPTAFSLHSSSNLDTLPEAARMIVSKDPNRSQFIALDHAGTLEHIIYIARTNLDGSKRSAASQATDLAHEFGHFVQRTSLDYIVKAATRSDDIASRKMLGDLLGIEVAEFEDPLVKYQNMTLAEQDMVDEMFADRLAAELLRANKTLLVGGKTFVDVVSAKDTGTFLSNLAYILKQLFDKFSKAKAYKGNFNAFLEAMTGRESSQYYDLVQAGGRRGRILERPKVRVQYQGNPMQRATQFRKMMDSRFVKSVVTGISHFYGTDTELRGMKSKTATWIARQIAHKTGDVGAAGHGSSYLKLLNNYHGELSGKFLPILNSALPMRHHFSATPPISAAFLAKVKSFTSMQTPLDLIPADLNFVVEENGKGEKNVTLNVRDTVEQVRNYYKELLAFQTATGAKMAQRENYTPQSLVSEKVRDNIDAFKAALKKNITTQVYGKQGGIDVLVDVSETGWSPKEINNLVDQFLNGKNPGEDPFATLQGMVENPQQQMGLFGVLSGPSNQAAKTRKISPARWQALIDFTNDDPADMITTRTGQAVKARAADDKFGSWMVQSKGLVGGYGFSTMDREQYNQYMVSQYAKVTDLVVTQYGRPYLTDDAIAEAGGRGESTRRLVWERRRILENALLEDATGKTAELAKELTAKLKEALAKNYYTPMGKLDAALLNGQDVGDLTTAQVIRIQDVIIPAVFGRLGQDEMGASWRAAQAYLMTGMNIVFLPTAVFSSMAELAQIGVRLSDPLMGKGMWASQGKMLSKLLKGLSSKGTEADIMTKQLGIIKDAAIESAITASVESEYQPLNAREVNQKFFEITGLKWFTDYTRRVAYLSGKDALRDYASQAKAGNAQAIAQAKVLGLNIDEANTMSDSDWIQTDGFKNAIYTWIEEATLRPGPDTRPARFSDPRFAMLWYLKDFQWAMYARTGSYVMQQSKLQPSVARKMLPWVAAAIPMMVAGMIGSAAKDLITNIGPAAVMGVKPTDRYKSAWDVTWSAMQRSGIMGPSEMLAQTAFNLDRRGISWLGMAGPVATTLQDMATRGTGRVMQEKIPGVSMFSKPVKDAILTAVGFDRSTSE